MNNKHSNIIVQYILTIQNFLHFSAAIPDCQTLNPSAPLSIISRSDGDAEGSIATYACAPGYSLVGDSTRQCAYDAGLSTSYWSGDEPSCKPGK